MKIIDFAKKGNVVRFYLGEKDPEWGWTDKGYKVDGETPDYLKPSEEYYGDDWNDCPYQHNAGSVYPYFVKGYKDVSFAFDDLVFEPQDGDWRKEYCKNDMAERKIPCIVVVKKDRIPTDGCLGIDFDSAAMMDASEKYWFGDDMEPDVCSTKQVDPDAKLYFDVEFMKCKCPVCGEEADAYAMPNIGDQYMDYRCGHCGHTGAIKAEDAYWSAK